MNVKKAILGTILSLVLLSAFASAQTFIQANSATAATGSSSVIGYTNPQTAGNLNVVAVMWGDTTSTVTSVTDSLGNTYVRAIGPTTTTALTSSIYYAKNIAAGSNIVTVAFNTTATAPNVNVLEYSGLDRTAPLDVTAGAVGTGTLANSGSATTTAAAELIVGVGNPSTGFTAAGSGFTSRIINSFGGITEDRVVASAGSNSATATLTSGNWTMQMATFKVSTTVVHNVKTNCGAVGNGTTNDTSAINTCEAALSPGDTLEFPAGTYLAPAGVNPINVNGVLIDGSNNAATLKATSGTAMTIGTNSLSAKTPLLAATVDGATSFTAASGFVSTLSAGSLVYISEGGVDGNCSPSGTSTCDSSGSATAIGCEIDGCRSEVAQVAAASGTTVTVTKPLNNPYDPTVNVAGVQKLNTVVSGVTVQNMTFDGSGTATTGLQLLQTSGLLVSGVHGQNTTGTAIACGSSGSTACGWLPVFNNITITAAGGNGGGNGAAFAIALVGYPTVNTATVGPNLNASGFGMTLGMSGGAQMNGITIDKAPSTTIGRGLKESAAAHTTFANLTLKNAPAGYNGMDVTYYSHHTTINVCNASANSTVDIASFGNYNDFLTLNSCNMSVGSNGGLVAFEQALSNNGRRDTNVTINGGAYNGTSGFELIQIGGANATIQNATFGPATQGINFLVAGLTGICINNNVFASGMAYAYAKNGGTGFANGNTLNGNGTPGGALPTGTCGVVAPTLTIAPLSYNFNSITTGSSASQNYTLTNTGTAAATGVTVTVSDTVNFSVAACGTGTLAAGGGNCTAAVTAHPTTTGTHNATLTITSNAPTITAPLTVIGQQPGCTPGNWSLTNQPPNNCIPYPNGLFQKPLPHAGTGGPTDHLYPNSDAIIQHSFSISIDGNQVHPDPGFFEVAGPFNYHQAGISEPIYYGQASDPVYQVSACQLNTANGYPTSFPQFNAIGLKFHAPSGAFFSNYNPVANTGFGDMFFTVWDQTDNVVMGAYNFGTNNISLTACPGGGHAGTNADPCPTPSWRSCDMVNWSTGQDYEVVPGANGALDVGGLVGEIRANEWIAGAINHALYLNIGCEGGSNTVFPDLMNPADVCAPADTLKPLEGNLIFFDYTDAQINAMNLPPWQKTLITTMTHYGGYIGDAGSPTSFSFLIPSRYEGDQAYELQGLTNPIYAYLTGQTGVVKDSASDNSYTLGMQAWGNIPNVNGTAFQFHMHIADPCVPLGMVGLSGGCPTTPTGPIPTFNPNPLTFGVVPVSTSVTAILTLTNTGGSNLTFSPATITGANTTSFKILSTTCTTPLAVNTPCSYTIQFTPAAAGALTANLTLTSNATTSPTSIVLSGTGGAASLVFSPTSLTFGTTGVGSCSAAQTFTATNPGNIALTINGQSFTGAAAGDYKATTGTCLPGPTTLNPGGSCTVGQQFCPTAAGARAANTAVASTLANSPTLEPLTGTGGVATLSISPGSATCPSQQVGTSAACQTFTVTNNGAVAANSIVVSITGTGGGSFSQTNSCTTLAPAGTCPINLSFAPLAPGTLNATLQISSTASNSPLNAALTGTGIAASVTLTPASINFQSVLIGVTTAPQTATVTNTGVGPVTISSIGQTGPFSASNVNCPISPSTIAAGGHCTINVTATPVALGIVSGTLVVNDSATGSPHQATLSVNGTQAGVGFAPPSPLNFGNQPVGSTTAPQSITFSNPGTGPLTFSLAKSGANPGDFTINSTGCPSPLGPGLSCTITTTFTPGAPTARSATIVSTDNAPGSPHSYTVQGTGVAVSPAVCLSQTSVNFGNQPVNSTSNPTPITVTNCGTGSLVVSAVTPTGNFGETNTCGTVAPAGTCQINATFSPLSAGTLNGQLSMASNAASSPTIITLTGFGTTQGVSLTPGSIAFGSFTVGVPSTAHTLTLANNGNTSVSVNTPTITGANPNDYTFNYGTCQPPVPTLQDDFSESVLDPTKWVIDTGAAPGTIAGVNTGTFATANVVMGNGALALKLTQSGAAPVISIGGEVRSINTFGYGTYIWNAREASVATTPTGAGSTVSGQVSGLFNYFQNNGLTAPNFTEDDFEVEGQHPTQLELTTWTSSSPPVNTETNSTQTGMDTAFHQYKYVWQPGVLNYSFDGGAISTHNTNVPTSPAFVIMNLWGTNSTSEGGLATVGTTRWMYINGFSFTPLSATLAPNASCTYTVTFKPLAAGGSSATFNQTFGNGIPTVTSSLSGTGVAAVPAVTITPIPQDFGNVTQGTTSGLKTDQVANSGTAPLVITSATLTGTNNTDYAIVNDHCTGQTVAAGSFCTVDISVTPQGLGARTANLHLIDNAADTPQNAALTVNGVAAPTPKLTLSTSTLTFSPPSIQTGHVSASQTVTATNTGNANLIVTHPVALGGANATDFTVTDNCGTVAPGLSCAAVVNCAPQTAGSKTATVTFLSNAASSPDVVNLTCIGFVGTPTIVVGATSISFGNQTVGTISGPAAFTLTNTGSADASGVAISSVNSGDFPITTSCGSTIAQGASCQVTTNFSPQVLCGQVNQKTGACLTNVHSGQINIVSNTSNSPQVVTLTGTAVPAPPPPGPIVITMGGSLTMGGHFVAGVQ